MGLIISNSDVNTKAEGEMYIDGNTNVTTISAVDTWTDVADFVAGKLNQVTFASNKLTVLETGTYDVEWNLSSQAAVANKTFEFCVTVETTQQDKTVIARRYSSADVGASSGGGYIDLNAGDEVFLQVQNLTDATNITVTQANLRLHKI